jgi:threonyl-tRNA synthetase
MSPDQVRIIPITDNHNEYALRLEKRLKDLDVRAQADLGADRMNAKIRQAQNFKVPYMLVVGDREMAENTVSLRKRDGSKVNDMAVQEFIALVQDRVKNRSSEL